MENKGMNHQDAKMANKSLVLKLIATEGPISRSELSRLTDLSKMTITNIIADYIREGIVEEIGAAQSQSGRKPQLLDVISDSRQAISVSASRDGIDVGTIGLKGEILSFEHSDFDDVEDNDSFYSKIKRMVDKIFTDDIRSKVWGIGVCCIGPIDIQRGILLNPHSFYNIRNIPIASMLERDYNLPVFMDNDMSCAALAEMYYGCAKKLSNFVYVGVASGLGTGIVIDGKLYGGDRGFSGELGHTSVNADGPLCPCGNPGCLEIYCSTLTIVKRIAAELKNGAQTSLKESTWKGIVSEARKGDPYCTKIIEDFVRYLSVGVVNLVNLFDPDCIVFGHDILAAQDLVGDRIAKYIDRHRFAISKKTTRVLFSTLDAPFPGASSLIGAAALVLHDKIG